MPNQPLVTVIIPLYNEVLFFEKTLLSVINQSYKNISIFISDNGSSDGSYDLAKKYALLDSRINVFQQNPPLTALENFNFLFSSVKTKYLFFLGAHDLLGEHFIDSAANIMENDNAIALVTSKAQYIDENDKLQQAVNDDIASDSDKVTDRLYRALGGLIHCESIHGLYRTKIVQKISFSKTRGPDNVVLYNIASLGKINRLEDINLTMRIVRKETHNERMKRYAKDGVVGQSFFYKYISLHYNLIKSTLSFTNINLVDKLILSLKLLKAMIQYFLQIQKLKLIKKDWLITYK